MDVARCAKGNLFAKLSGEAEIAKNSATMRANSAASSELVSG
jgi:hypothetical protein